MIYTVRARRPRSDRNRWHFSDTLFSPVYIIDRFFFVRFVPLVNYVYDIFTNGSGTRGMLRRVWLANFRRSFIPRREPDTEVESFDSILMREFVTDTCAGYSLFLFRRFCFLAGKSLFW